MTNIILTVVSCGAILVVGYWLGRRDRRAAIVVARQGRRVAEHERDAAQRETANMLAKQDRLIWSGRAARASLREMYLDWLSDLNEWEGENAANLATIRELQDLIRERGMHDDAVAAAHEAEVVEEDLPLWATVTSLYALPAATGHTQEIRRDLIQAALEAAVPA